MSFEFLRALATGIGWTLKIAGYAYLLVAVVGINVALVALVIYYAATGGL